MLRAVVGLHFFALHYELTHALLDSHFPPPYQLNNLKKTHRHHSTTNLINLFSQWLTSAA
jgi:hypothetical protein